MCNAACIFWVLKNISESEIRDKRILEVGSMDVNGSPRLVIERLEPSGYIGIDLAPGPGVDIVCKCEELVERFGEESFDFIISTCALEHIEDWKTSISNIKKVCKKKGYILIIVPGKWPQHDYPHDYWRFSKDDMVYIFSDCKILKLNSDYQPGRDEKGNVAPLSLTYIKCQKPDNFSEINLDDFEVEGVS